MPLRRRGEDGWFVSNFEANRLDGIETPLPDLEEDFETATERDASEWDATKWDTTEWDATERDATERDTEDMARLSH